MTRLQTLRHIRTKIKTPEHWVFWSFYEIANFISVLLNLETDWSELSLGGTIKRMFSPADRVSAQLRVIVRHKLWLQRPSKRTSNSGDEGEAVQHMMLMLHSGWWSFAAWEIAKFTFTHDQPTSFTTQSFLETLKIKFQYTSTRWFLFLKKKILWLGNSTGG